MEKQKIKKIRKGTVRIQIKSRKGDDNNLIIEGILPTEKVAKIIEFLVVNRL